MEQLLEPRRLPGVVQVDLTRTRSPREFRARLVRALGAAAPGVEFEVYALDRRDAQSLALLGDLAGSGDHPAGATGPAGGTTPVELAAILLEIGARAVHVELGFEPLGDGKAAPIIAAGVRGDVEALALSLEQDLVRLMDGDVLAPEDPSWAWVEGRPHLNLELVPKRLGASSLDELAQCWFGGEHEEGAAPRAALRVQVAAIVGTERVQARGGTTRLLHDLKVAGDHPLGRRVLSRLLRTLDAADAPAAARLILSLWTGSSHEAWVGSRRALLGATLGAREEVLRELSAAAAPLLRAGNPVTSTRLQDLFIAIECLRPALAPRLPMA